VVQLFIVTNSLQQSQSKNNNNNNCLAENSQKKKLILLLFLSNNVLVSSINLQVKFAPYYVAFFDLRTAQLVCTLEQEDPQPEIEHQAGAFVLVSPATATKKVWALVLSTEGGKMLACTEPEISTDVTASDSAEPVVVPAKWISVHEIASTPEEIRKMQLAQQKQSLYQVATNRIRSIASMGATCEGIVTASSSGEIRCWVARTVGSSTLQKIDLIECTVPIQVGGRVTCVSSSLI
jgi:hypothetical protein